MGSWGVGIFSNDEGADLRDDFKDLVGGGLDAAAATEQLCDDYGVGGRGVDDHDFWLALASIQHSTGHVVTDVIQRARAITQSPEEIERWPSGERRRRQITLDKLARRLATEPPAPRRLRPRPRVDTSLKEGQHLLVPAGDRRLLLRVVAIREDRGGRSPVALLLAWDGRERTLRRAHRLRAVPEHDGDMRDAVRGFWLIGEPGDPADLVVLDRVTDRRTPPAPRHSQWVVRWSALGGFVQDTRA